MDIPVKERLTAQQRLDLEQVFRKYFGQRHPPTDPQKLAEELTQEVEDFLCI